MIYHLFKHLYICKHTYRNNEINLFILNIKPEKSIKTKINHNFFIQINKNK